MPSTATPVHSRRLIGCLLLAALAAAAPGAQAATPSGPTGQQRIDKRQDRQAQRIEQGASSGALTPHETRRLGREQAGIVRAEARAEADGKLTRHEAGSLERRQDRASRDIYSQKHDRQSRGGR